MEKHKSNHRLHIVWQVDRVRKLYSQIGEPLPVDVIIDLHHHLADALEIASEQACKGNRKAKKSPKNLN